MTDSPPEARPIAPRPRTLLAASAWVGLAAGLAEVAAARAIKAAGGPVTLEDLRVHRHANWMIPASDAMIFAAIGAMLVVARRIRPGIVARIAAPALAIPAFGALLLRVPSLHRYACWTLAAGFGVQAGRLAVKHGSTSRKVVRWTLAPMAAVAIALVAVEAIRVGRSESRALASLPAASKGMPNVLLLVMDTVRADHLSLHGYPRDTSPNLARLAKSGTRFDRAIAPSPWTLPSHASMFTGRWPSELSSGAVSALDDRYPTLAEALSAKGYATGGFVANTYYCNSVYGLDRGFARYEDFDENVAITFGEVARSSSLGRRLALWMGLDDEGRPGHEDSRKSAAQVNADLLRWVDRTPGRPFFGFVNYYDAHGPYDPPAGHDRRFGLSALPEAERDDLLLQRTLLARGKPPTGGRRPEDLLPRITELLRDSYDDCLASLDLEIGRLFDQLRERDLLANTLIVITSDHGEHFGEHGLFGHGTSLYEPEVHVPLLILGPGVPRGLVVDESVSPRDLPATVLDLLGQGAGSPFPGRSLAGHFGVDFAEDAVFTEVEHQTKFRPSPVIPASRGAVRGVVRGRFAYILHADGSEELYDVRADPKQANNLAGAGAASAELERLRSAMAEVAPGSDRAARVAREGRNGAVVR